MYNHTRLRCAAIYTYHTKTLDVSCATLSTKFLRFSSCPCTCTRARVCACACSRSLKVRSNTTHVRMRASTREYRRLCKPTFVNLDLFSRVITFFALRRSFLPLLLGLSAIFEARRSVHPNPLFAERKQVFIARNGSECSRGRVGVESFRSKFTKRRSWIDFVRRRKPKRERIIPDSKWKVEKIANDRSLAKVSVVPWLTTTVCHLESDRGSSKDDRTTERDPSPARGDCDPRESDRTRARASVTSNAR